MRIIRILFLLLIWSSLWVSSSGQNSAKPNIILILIDDGRYQDYASTGGPSWFESPSINRIADEGINFKSNYTVLALCEPSRVSILTGLYPHHSGFKYNTQVYDTSILTIARILRENGYYTGLVGKFLNEFNAFPSNDFNYWFAFDADANYNPQIFNLNGIDTFIDKHVSVAINEFTIDFLNSVPDSLPFFLMMCHKAPHPPYAPFEGYEEYYHDEFVEAPSNFHGYVKNYPGYLYYDNLFIGDSSKCVDDIQSYYEVLAGAEAGVDSVLNFLESNNILDSTLVIFTSDNGVFIGEHNLRKKRFAYEESMHTPLFIRYPAWFTPGTVVQNEFSLNLDLFPTILAAASVPGIFNYDGLSLHDLASGLVHRKEFLFQYFFDTVKPEIPDFRAIRDLQYKYIRSSCDQPTEEFFDLAIDPKEDSNQIFNPLYYNLIELYRDKLDSLRLSIGDDSSEDTTIACSLLNTDSIYLNNISVQKHFSITISPNPVKDFLTIHVSSSEKHFFLASITDLSGKPLRHINIGAGNDHSREILNVPVYEFPQGLYILNVTSDRGFAARLKFVIN